MPFPAQYVQQKSNCADYHPIWQHSCRFPAASSLFSVFTSKPAGSSVVFSENVEENHLPLSFCQRGVYILVVRKDFRFIYHTSCVSPFLFLEMLALNSLRMLCSSRALLLPNWFTTGRQRVYKAVTCSGHCYSTSCTKEDTWQSSMNFIPHAKGKVQRCCIKPVRTFCAAQVEVKCWNCNQPLDSSSPAFFCLSCKVVQPPEAGTSYFKIMDW